MGEMQKGSENTDKSGKSVLKC